jgi:hypothetical protein
MPGPRSAEALQHAWHRSVQCSRPIQSYSVQYSLRCRHRHGSPRPKGPLNRLWAFLPLAVSPAPPSPAQSLPSNSALLFVQVPPQHPQRRKLAAPCAKRGLSFHAVNPIHAAGTVRHSASSRIPDLSAHVLNRNSLQTHLDRSAYRSSPAVPLSLEASCCGNPTCRSASRVPYPRVWARAGDVHFFHSAGTHPQFSRCGLLRKCLAIPALYRSTTCPQPCNACNDVH